MSDWLRVRLELAFSAVVLLAAIAVWALWPAKPIPENVAPAPQVIQSDGSIITQRAPDSHPKPPPHVLPHGSVEERRGTIVAAPAMGASSVEVDYSLVRMPDHGRRVIVSSPDGSVNSAIDVPIDPSDLPPPPKPWAAGLSYTSNREVGMWLERDIGRLRFGAEVAKGAGKPHAELRVGVTF